MSREQAMKLAEAVRNAVIAAWQNVDAPEGRSDSSRILEELESMESVDLSSIIAAHLPDLEQQAKDADRYNLIHQSMSDPVLDQIISRHLQAIEDELGEDKVPTKPQLDAVLDAAMKESGHD